MDSINGWKIIRDEYFEKVLKSKKGNFLVLKRDKLNWELWSAKYNQEKYYGIRNANNFVKRFTKSHSRG